MNPEFQPQITQMNTDDPAAEEHLRSSVPSAAKKEPAPKISVIVPVYKVEKYLPECIESVLAQTFPDFEMILVDDGSPDNSGAICDDYAARDPRIRVFHKENGGVSSARNLGLDHARGEWIAFVDSDDTVGEKYLEHLWGDGPAAGTLIFSGLTYLDEKGRETRRLQFAAGTRPVREAFREEQLYRCGYPFSKLYDARVVARERLRFDPEISMAEDMILMADYLRFASSVVFRADSSDYRYWFRSGSLSKRYEAFENAFKLFLRGREMFDSLCERPLVFRERSALRWYFFRAISCLYRPPFPPRAERLEKLHRAYSELRGGEFTIADVSFRGRLFLKKRFRAFDFLTKLLFRLRYGVLAPAWSAYRAWVNASAHRRNRPNGGGLEWTPPTAGNALRFSRSAAETAKARRVWTKSLRTRFLKPWRKR